VHEQVALTGSDPQTEDPFWNEEEVVFKQWEDLMGRLNQATDKIWERERTWTPDLRSLISLSQILRKKVMKP